MPLFKVIIRTYDAEKPWIGISEREIWIIAPSRTDAESIANQGLPDDQSAHVMEQVAPRPKRHEEIGEFWKRR